MNILFLFTQPRAFNNVGDTCSSVAYIYTKQLVTRSIQCLLKNTGKTINIRGS